MRSGKIPVDGNRGLFFLSCYCFVLDWLCLSGEWLVVNVVMMRSSKIPVDGTRGYFLKIFIVFVLDWLCWSGE